MFNINRTVKKRILNKKEFANQKNEKIIFFFKKVLFKFDKMVEQDINIIRLSKDVNACAFLFDIVRYLEEICGQ